MKSLRAPLAVILAASLAGCTVGPDYHPPKPPTEGRYTTSPQPGETASADTPAGGAQRFEEARDIPADWWQVFQSKALDELVRRALADSPQLAGTRAKLTRAQQDLKARRGEKNVPAIDAGLRVNSVDVHPESLGVPALPIDTPLTLYDASVSISYTLDLFGKTRRELEALQADVDVRAFEDEGTRLMLAGNVVTAAIRMAALHDEIEQTEAVVALQEQRLTITQRLEALGGVPHLDVVTQSGELARTRAGLPALHEALEQTRHRLAVYLGQAPGDAEIPDLKLSDLTLPAELPLTLPSELVRQRPDIRAAEALLHEASARVGVATANFYPQLTLSGTAGSLATALGDLFSSGTGFYFLGANLVQKLFRGGELKAQKRSAVAAFDEAGAAYQETVLEGLRNVADTLVALDADAKTLKERADAARFAEEAYEITSKRYESGGVSHVELIDAERRHREATVELTQAAADRYADSAALFQALGGGWWSQAPAEGGAIRTSARP